MKALQKLVWLVPIVVLAIAAEVFNRGERGRNYGLLGVALVLWVAGVWLIGRCPPPRRKAG